MRGPKDLPEPDLETQLREAFTADDPEAAWYLDRAEERVVRVAHGVTSIPDLSASDVEEDDARYVEIPVVTESDVHLWMEEFVDLQPDPAIAPLLDEKQGANRRFLDRLAASHPDVLKAWRSFESARVEEALAAWRATLG